MDTPVTPDNSEEIILCGTQIGRRTDEEVGTEVKGGTVEKLGFCTEACPRLKVGPAEDFGEEVVNWHLMVERSEDAAPCSQLRVAQNASVTFEQSVCENIKLQASVELLRTSFEDLSEGTTLTSVMKERVLESNTSVLEEWESGEANKCRSQSVA